MRPARAAGRKRRPTPIDFQALGEYEAERTVRRLHNAIGAVVCSETWHADCYAAVVNGHVEHKAQQARELNRVGLYPPGGDDSLMLRCDDCGQRHPPQSVSREFDGATGQLLQQVCGPCNEGRRLKPSRHVGDLETAYPPENNSATRDALDEMHRRGAVIETQIKLAAEDEASLRRMIERYEEGAAARKAGVIL